MEMMGVGKFFHLSHVYEDFWLQVFTLESFVCYWKQDDAQAAVLVNWESAGTIGDENREKS